VVLGVLLWVCVVVGVGGVWAVGGGVGFVGGAA